MKFRSSILLWMVVVTNSAAPVKARLIGSHDKYHPFSDTESALTNGRLLAMMAQNAGVLTESAPSFVESTVSKPSEAPLQTPSQAPLTLLAAAEVVNAQPQPLAIQAQEDLSLFVTYLGQEHQAAAAAAAAVFGYNKELWDSEGAVVIPPANSYTDSGQNSIIDIAIGANFSTMLFALNQTAWFNNLQTGEGPYTFFAVPDDGFDSLSPKFYTDPQWNTHLANILTYHILDREVSSGNWEVVGTQENTVNLNPLTVTSIDPLAINGINVTATNISASNGIIHIVKEVLLPASAIDSALDLVAKFPQLSILNELVNLVNLTKALDGEGPITLAAPQNSAFEALPEGTLDSLRSDPDALTDILLYHVVPELVDFVSVPANGGSYITAQGSKVTYFPSDPKFIGEAEVELADLLVSNGYFHLINSVLIPLSPSIAPTTQAPTPYPTVAPEDDRIIDTVVGGFQSIADFFVDLCVGLFSN